MKFNIALAAIAVATIGLFAFTTKTQTNETTSAKVVVGGIKFNKITYDKALKQAKSSKKLIFIDIYTSWCGPCKQMAKTTFQSEKVGNYFNEKFINLKLDAELEADGTKVATDFKVTAYPTMLFINGDGKLIKRVVGYQTEEKLLAAAEGLK